MSEVRMLVLATALVFGMLGVSAVNTNKVEAKELSGVKSVGIDRVSCGDENSVLIASNSPTCWANSGGVAVALYNVYGVSARGWRVNVQYFTDANHHIKLWPGDAYSFIGFVFVNAIRINP
ncbi:MAG: hypothetical protein LBT99_00720 [Bifidobacteriaceae bacterium]|nr:hypothetical protein [Bifidobacteriaceae bacterium]